MAALNGSALDALSSLHARAASSSSMRAPSPSPSSSPSPIPDVNQTLATSSSSSSFSSSPTPFPNPIGGERYLIRGVHVDFPYPAYECQQVYMEKVIQAVQLSQHALLESPTGTGKTLCLLCAVLAWRQAFIAKSADNTTDLCSPSHRNNKQFERAVSVAARPWQPLLTSYLI